MDYSTRKSIKMEFICCETRLNLKMSQFAHIYIYSLEMRLWGKKFTRETKMLK